MTRYLLFFVLFILFVYGAIKAWPLIEGPSLLITSPENNTSSTNGIVTIEGIAARAAQLTLNGTMVLHEGDGRFSSTLALPRGNSMMTLIATDRFGRKTTATRTIFVP